MAAKNREWDLWEKRIVVDAHLQGIHAVKVPQKFQMGVRVKSEPDFCISVNGRAVFFDAKVTKERLWNLKEYVTHPKKIHQFKQLLSAHYRGSKSGFLCWFTHYDCVVWIPSQVIKEALEKNVASIHPFSPGVRRHLNDSQIFFQELIFGEGPFLNRVSEGNYEERQDQTKP